jgi:hypothetical protein
MPKKRGSPGGTTAAARFLQPLDHLAEVAADRHLLPGKIGKELELALTAQQQIGLADQFKNPAGKPLLPFHPGTNHVDFFHDDSALPGQSPKHPVGVPL